MLLVLFGQGIERKPAAQTVQAFAVGQRAAGQYFGDDGVAVEGLYHQRDQSVVQQQGVTGRDILDQTEITDTDLGFVAQRGIRAADQVEFAAVDQVDFVVGEFFNTDLGTLQIGQNADFTPETGGNLAHAGHPLGMLLGGTVREVHAHHVDAGFDDLSQNAGLISRRAERGEDFGAAEIGGGHRVWFSFRGGDADSVAAQWQGLRKAVQA